MDAGVALCDFSRLRFCPSVYFLALRRELEEEEEDEVNEESARDEVPIGLQTSR
jgi:hypothetical protein